MSFFNRQLYKQKPSAWGPVSAVQASIFKNAERMGIDPGSIALCMPMWGPGDQIDYASNISTANLSEPVFNDNAISFDGTDDAINTKMSEGLQPLTIISTFRASLKDSNVLFSHGIWNVGAFYVQFSNRPLLILSNGNYQYFSVNDAQSDNEYHTWSVYIAGAGLNGIYDTALYIDGKQITKDTKAKTTAPTAYTHPLHIGTVQNANTNNFIGKIKQFYAFRGKISYSQIAYLSDNPYFLLHRVPPVFYNVPGGGVLPTFNPLFLNAAQPTRVIQ